MSAACALIWAQVGSPPLTPSSALPVATGPLCGHHVLAQEDLVRGMRGIGLVLVDEGRGEVRGLAVCVDRRPRQHHEVGLAAFDVKRIVRLQRDEDGAALPLGDEVEAVVEELAEEREPRVERRRQALVGRDVRHDQALAGHLEALRGDDGLQGREGGCLVGVRVRRWRPCRRRPRRDRRERSGLCGALDAREVERLLHRGRVGGRHVDDQVRNGARGRIDDDRPGLVRGRIVVRLRRPKPRAGSVQIHHREAVRYSGSSRSGNGWSAEPQSVRPGIRLL